MVCYGPVIRCQDSIPGTSTPESRFSVPDTLFLTHNRSVLFQLGDTLTSLGIIEEGRKYVSAAKVHDTLFELLERVEDPKRRNDFRLLIEVASAALKVGLPAEARAWYLVALQLDPTTLKYRNKSTASIIKIPARTPKPRLSRLVRSP